MTNPAMGWLVLRRAAEKRPPLYPDQRKWVIFGLHRQAFPSESQVGFEISQRVTTMAESEAANGKCRLMSLLVLTAGTILLLIRTIRNAHLH